jgi:cytochrome d ubiquinol oxidase subunit I
MGVVSGLVMAYQFGTNWSGFSQFAGSITGPLLTYEVLTAFFLEAGFLGVMLFGWNKVGPGLHFFSTCMVALGTIISTFWILASNSWMQTPQGMRSSTARWCRSTGSPWCLTLLPLPPAAYVDSRIPEQRAVCRRIGGMASAARQ